MTHTLKWASNWATALAKHILMTTHNIQVTKRIFPSSYDTCVAGIKLYDLRPLSAAGGSRNLFHFQSEITLWYKLLLTVQHLLCSAQRWLPSQRLCDLLVEAEGLECLWAGMYLLAVPSVECIRGLKRWPHKHHTDQTIGGEAFEMAIQKNWGVHVYWAVPRETSPLLGCPWSSSLSSSRLKPIRIQEDLGILVNSRVESGSWSLFLRVYFVVVVVLFFNVYVCDVFISIHFYTYVHMHVYVGTSLMLGIILWCLFICLFV